MSAKPLCTPLFLATAVFLCSSLLSVKIASAQPILLGKPQPQPKCVTEKNCRKAANAMLVGVEFDYFPQVPFQLPRLASLPSSCRLLSFCSLLSLVEFILILSLSHSLLC